MPVRFSSPTKGTFVTYTWTRPHCGDFCALVVTTRAGRATELARRCPAAPILRRLWIISIRGFFPLERNGKGHPVLSLQQSAIVTLEAASGLLARDCRWVLLSPLSTLHLSRTSTRTVLHLCYAYSYEYY